MVILRPTAKLFRSLLPAEEPLTPSDTALGDWYVSSLKVDYQPLLLLLSAQEQEQGLIVDFERANVPVPKRRVGGGERLLRR